jgi:catechol 2,3-dioxygenase-like lactoylglutathione lyase family enzyme
MAALDLNLVVVRCADLEASAAFYRALGLRFERHQHEGGPEHLSGDLGGCVFELYSARVADDITRGVRVGFVVDSIEDALRDIGECVVSPPSESEWGRRAVVRDPDGNKVELLEALPAHAARWRLVRQDDHGRRFVVETFAEQSKAEHRLREFLQKQHKQDYWMEAVTDDSRPKGL